MRRARHKNSESTYYHILTRVAGAPDFCPLEEWEAWTKLYLMIVQFTRAYGCVLVSLEILGTHYHFILWMEQFRKLTRPELARRARLLWGEQEAVRKMAQWDEAGWERFNRRLFDLSALMQHLNGEYAKWYNRTHGRHGHFWGDRFKNPELLDLEAVQKCLAYIETNATRAHLIDWPENWEASSTWRRFRGETGDLMPLETDLRGGAGRGGVRGLPEAVAGAPAGGRGAGAGGGAHGCRESQGKPGALLQRRHRHRDAGERGAGAGRVPGRRPLPAPQAPHSTDGPALHPARTALSRPRVSSRTQRVC